MATNHNFSSRIGLIAATVGSAVGLGNVWRFPAEVQQGGGAAFLLIYVACVFLLGIPVMVSEFALGRAGRSDAVGSMLAVGASRRWSAAGAWAIAASYLILCFYMVVAGWTLLYLWQAVSGQLFTATADTAGADAFYIAKMNAMISSGSTPIVATLIMIGLNLAILMAGVRKGIERISSIAMPLLFIILVAFVCVSLSLPGSMDGVLYFLKPDFSKVTPSIAVDALGQAFFSLSLGMGILITYASYFPHRTPLVRTATITAALDLLVAVMMGLIIFPAVTAFGLQDHELHGATLVFVTLPEVFAQMPGAQLWAILFFLLLTLAALTSTISIAEVSVAFVAGRFGISRRSACLVVLLPLIVFSSICSLSMGPWSHITFDGLNIFSILDNVATNIMLPAASFALCIFMGWRAPRRLMADQLSTLPEGPDGIVRLTPAQRACIAIVRYVAPALILLILLSPLF